jgi:hypothetical protein
MMGVKYVKDFDFGPAKTYVKGYARGGSCYAEGGRADVKQDKAMIKAAVHKHEKGMHPGKPMTKLARGGSLTAMKNAALTAAQQRAQASPPPAPSNSAAQRMQEAMDARNRVLAQNRQTVVGGPEFTKSSQASPAPTQSAASRMQAAQSALDNAQRQQQQQTFTSAGRASPQAASGAQHQAALQAAQQAAMRSRPMAKGGQAKVGQAKVGKVMREFKAGELHSGKNGPVVKSPKQAMAIALSEARAAKKRG